MQAGRGLRSPLSSPRRARSIVATIGVPPSSARSMSCSGPTSCRRSPTRPARSRPIDRTYRASGSRAEDKERRRNTRLLVGGGMGARAADRHLRKVSRKGPSRQGRASDAPGSQPHLRLRTGCGMPRDSKWLVGWGTRKDVAPARKNVAPLTIDNRAGGHSSHAIAHLDGVTDPCLRPP